MAAYAAVPVNPRAAAGGSATSARQSTVGALTRSVINKTRTRVGARSRSATATTRTPVLKTAKAAVARAASSGVHAGAIRGAGVSRAATNALRTNARAGKNVATTSNGLARAGVARATAVFNDVSKIGAGYAQCRESYATCMDQMCANANDTYRRCFCSERFTQIRNTENALDQAMIMLQQFQDNNLNAVDKTAAEVNAMYTATVGEEAIKRDTSASAQLLNNIDDLLSGKKPAASQSNTSNSMTALDLDITSTFDNGDIWSSNDNSIFATQEQDMSTMEGSALFNAAQKQCVRLTQNNCENDAVFNMTKSSYNILIAQDCNAYEKTLDKKKETVTQAIRTAEKYLREARLEEYRSHNSADVNECLTKVRTAMLSETACGEDYKRCLDPTGAYISAATGEPIYSPRLFALEKTISLNGMNSGQMADILAENKSYENFLENYRKYVTRELDTCRDISDFVWTEFKRTAIIEIAQAQSAKLEEVRSSCVSTIAECYDTQSDQLVDFADDDTSKNTSVTAGALGRYTAASLCKEKVTACATLYAPAGSNADCKFDGRGHLIGDGNNCGLQSLLNYVKAVDSINVADKCDKAIEKYLTDLCTPTNETQKYPYNCRTLTMDDLKNNIDRFANNNCIDPGSGSKEITDERVKLMIQTTKDNLESDMLYMFSELCEGLDGMWFDKKTLTEEIKQKFGLDNTQTLAAFYSNVFGRGSDSGSEWGTCYQNTDRVKCLSYNTDDEEIASWNVQASECVFKDKWYENQCSLVGGYYENALCYIFDAAEGN